MNNLILALRYFPIRNLSFVRIIITDLTRGHGQHPTADQLSNAQLNIEKIRSSVHGRVRCDTEV
jgi:hypothetical protein